MSRAKRASAAILVVVVVLAAVVVGGVGALTTDQADSQTQPVQIRACATITQPGQYVLVRDVVDSPNQACITVQASDVVFDGGGHTIDGANRQGIGIFVDGQSNVTVRNVTASDWNNGLQARNSENVSVVGASLAGNSVGVQTFSAIDTTLSNVTAADGDVGASLTNSAEIAVSGLNATGNRQGLVANRVDQFRLSNASLVNNSGIGATVQTSTNVSVADVLARQNGDVELRIAGGTVLAADSFQVGETTVSFVGRDVAIDEVVEAQQSLTGFESAGPAVDVRATAPGGWLNLTVRYDDDQLAGIDERTLALWRFRTGGWEQVLSPVVVDVDANTVTQNLTALDAAPAVYALLGEPGGEAAGNASNQSSVAEGRPVHP